MRSLLLLWQLRNIALILCDVNGLYIFNILYVGQWLWCNWCLGMEFYHTSNRNVPKSGWRLDHFWGAWQRKSEVPWTHSKNLDLMTLLSEGSKENEEHVGNWRKGDPFVSSARKLTEIVSCSYVQSRNSKWWAWWLR